MPTHACNNEVNSDKFPEMHPFIWVYTNERVAMWSFTNHSKIQCCRIKYLLDYERPASKHNLSIQPGISACKWRKQDGWDILLKFNEQSCAFILSCHQNPITWLFLTLTMAFPIKIPHSSVNHHRRWLTIIQKTNRLFEVSLISFHRNTNPPSEYASRPV